MQFGIFSIKFSTHVESKWSYACQERYQISDTKTKTMQHNVKNQTDEIFLLDETQLENVHSDNIGPRLLKLAAPFIAEGLTYICNKSINNSTFSDKWKEGKVRPLHKNGPKDDTNNYRPFSVLPVLSK